MSHSKHHEKAGAVPVGRGKRPSPGRGAGALSQSPPNGETAPTQPAGTEAAGGVHPHLAAASEPAPAKSSILGRGDAGGQKASGEGSREFFNTFQRDFNGVPEEVPTPAATQGDRLSSAIGKLSEKLAGGSTAVSVPKIRSFMQFLLEHARVRLGEGRFGPYTFDGREALIAIVDTIDLVLGSNTGEPLRDATIVVAGGAQFGKTILELNLAAFCTAIRMLNAGVYLPDDNLASQIVDVKFRPEVVDQIDWFASMTQIGKAVNKSGKAVNKKTAFMVTDGERQSAGLFAGLRKVPTSFSLDLAVRDEEDDIPKDKAKFVSGRLTTSKYRIQLIIGTQRIHGAGQNKQWEAGSQGVMMIGGLNPEDNWPQVCRCAVTGIPLPTDPQLTYDGDFKRAGSTETAAEYSPAGVYYLADPQTGDVLDRSTVTWEHRRPERIKMRHWSFRVSQLGIPAIDLTQIVAHWTRAVVDNEEMISFCCDRLAKPKSAAQALSPQILERARAVDPFDYAVGRPSTVKFAGLDIGDACWFFLRERGATPVELVQKAGMRRCLRVDRIAAGDVVRRVTDLCSLHSVSALFIDQRPLVNEARTLALRVNGLDALEHWPRVPTEKDAWIQFPGGLTWDGRNQRWLNLRCAVVRFTKAKLGSGIGQGFDEFEENGQTKFVPLIECNRYETIDRAVREFLTPAEQVIEVVGGRVREHPAMLLPRRVPGAPGVLETLDAHLLAGSQREKDDKSGEVGDYLDGIENHLLLADGYSALAETVVGLGAQIPPPQQFTPFDQSRRNRVLTERRDRTVMS